MTTSPADQPTSLAGEPRSSVAPQDIEMTTSRGHETIQFEQRSSRTDRRREVTPVPVRERRRRQRRREPLTLDDGFEQFNSVAFGVALRLTGNRQAADDITQELFLALWRRREPDAHPKSRSMRLRLADAIEEEGSATPGRGRVTSVGDAAEESLEENYEFTGWLPLGPTRPDVTRVDPQGSPADRRHPTVTVVIPTLNEAENLGHVFERLPTWIDEVIIVDGNSTDDTVAVATALRPDVKIVTQTGKGKGNALACGFRAATGDITVMLDADGSTDPAEIPRFVAALTNGYDFAKGTRFMTGGGSDDITPFRRLGNWGLTTMVNRIWGSQYSDLCYGYNAFWTKSLPASFSDCNGFEVETLMNVRLAASDIKVVEVPSFEAHRLSGTSNLKAGRDGRRVLRTILAEWLRPR